MKKWEMKGWNRWKGLLRKKVKVEFEIIEEKREMKVDKDMKIGR